MFDVVFVDFLPVAPALLKFRAGIKPPEEETKSANWSTPHTPSNHQKRPASAATAPKALAKNNLHFWGDRVTSKPQCTLLWPIPMWGTNNTGWGILFSPPTLPNLALCLALIFPYCTTSSLAQHPQTTRLQCCLTGSSKFLNTYKLTL